jgi:hypothetical protein
MPPEDAFFGAVFEETLPKTLRWETLWGAEVDVNMISFGYRFADQVKFWKSKFF